MLKRSTLDNSFSEQAQMKATAIKSQNDSKSLVQSYFSSFHPNSEFSSFPAMLPRKYFIYFNHSVE